MVSWNGNGNGKGATNWQVDWHDRLKKFRRWLTQLNIMNIPLVLVMFLWLRYKNRTSDAVCRDCKILSPSRRRFLTERWQMT
jgi:hypothetical protein